MGALLKQWLGGAAAISTIDDASVSQVREAIRTCGAASGLTTQAIERMAAAASELARNQIAHARGGAIAVRAVERAGVPGIEVIAADRGRGIPDPAAALRGSPRSAGSLGIGLSAAQRQVDELDVDIRLGAGTCICARTFAAPVARSEVAILARAHPDEVTIGDHAAIARTAAGVTIAIADGLGHGVPAREAADLAVECMLRDPGRPLDRILADAHAVLPGTRGAVMALARLDLHRRLEHTSIGNIASRIVGADGEARQLAAVSGTLGSAFPRRLPVEHDALGTRELLVLTTDGITTRVELADDPVRLHGHPVAVAQWILERFGRVTDDALVVVAR